MKKCTGKRVIAYVLDIIFVLVIASMFADINLLNPYKEEYEKASDEYIEELSTYMKQNAKYTNGEEVVTDGVKITEDQMLMTSYKLQSYSFYSQLILLVCIFLYFVVFQYFNKGKTVGKSIMHLQMVNKKEKNPNIIQLIIVSLLINSGLSVLLNVILIKTASSSLYLRCTTIIEYVISLFLMATLIRMMFKKNGVGYHDLISGTHVIYTKQEPEIVFEKQVKELEEVKSVKKTKTTSKPVAKKKTTTKKNIVKKEKK